MSRKVPEFRLLFVAGMLGKGGAEKQLFYLAQGLVKLGILPTLVTFAKGEFWESRISALGVPIVYFGQTKFRLWRIALLTRLLRQGEFDLVQSQHFYTNIYSAVAGKLSQTTSIGAIRNNVISEVNSNGPMWGRLCLRLPEFLAANSEVGIQNAAVFGVPQHRLRLLPNVIECDEYSPSLVESTNSEFTLLIVGNLHFVHKRVDLFIEVIAKLYKLGRHKVKATIVGEGPLRDQLETQVKASGLPDGTIQFLGRRDDLPLIYRDSDILVHTSEHEGTPNVIMEAMACGLPVVASRVGGIPDLVQDGETGYLIESGDMEGFVRRIAFLIDNPTIRQRMGKAGRKYIESNHSLEKLPDILGDFYSSILD